MQITMASPTAASAAATVMTKMANECPSSRTGSTKREKATRLMFAAFNINSMPMRIATAFRRVITP